VQWFIKQLQRNYVETSSVGDKVDFSTQQSTASLKYTVLEFPFLNIPTRMVPSGCSGIGKTVADEIVPGGGDCMKIK
jgi:hypothetical protein